MLMQFCYILECSPSEFYLRLDSCLNPLDCFIS